MASVEVNMGQQVASSSNTYTATAPNATFTYK